MMKAMFDDAVHLDPHLRKVKLANIGLEVDKVETILYGYDAGDYFGYLGQSHLSFAIKSNCKSNSWGHHILTEVGRSQPR